VGRRDGGSKLEQSREKERGRLREEMQAGGVERERERGRDCERAHERMLNKTKNMTPDIFGVVEMVMGCVTGWCGHKSCCGRRSSLSPHTLVA